MTWKEFKDYVEGKGVTDDSEIAYIWDMIFGLKARDIRKLRNKAVKKEKILSLSKESAKLWDEWIYNKFVEEYFIGDRWTKEEQDIIKNRSATPTLAEYEHTRKFTEEND